MIAGRSGNSAEEHRADDKRPDHLAVLRRRDAVGGRRSRRQDEAELRRAGEHTREGEEREVGGDRPAETLQHQDAVHQQGCQDDGRQQADPPLGLAERAQDDDGAGREEGNCKGRQMAELQRFEPRPHDREHAEEADRNREPAPPAHLLIEKEDRENGGDGRRQEDERIGFGEGQGGEGIDPKNAGRGAGHPAHADQQRAPHMDGVAPAFVPRLQEQQDERGEQGLEKSDLEHRQMAAQRLDVGVPARKQEVGEEAQGNALDRRMGWRHGCDQGSWAVRVDVASTPETGGEANDLMSIYQAIRPICRLPRSVRSPGRARPSKSTSKFSAEKSGALEPDRKAAFWRSR